jgi:uncharacterized protein YkwD
MSLTREPGATVSTRVRSTLPAPDPLIFQEGFFMSQPSAYEQLMLELINDERAASGAPPLAFNGDLNESAELHTSWMIATDTFSHTGSGGSDAGERMRDAGYGFSGSWTWGENIAWASNRDPAGFGDEVALLHGNLMNSPGHRANILDEAFREIGIGFGQGEFDGWNASAVTQNFALSGSSRFLTGVAFDDRDGDRSYDVGEGLGGLAVRAVSSTGQTVSATTMDAGGYGLALGAGTYTVTFSGGGIAASTRQVTVGGSNVKLDLVDPQGGGSGGSGGTPGNDVLTGTARSDVLQGLGGSDRLDGREGGDRLEGGIGDDVLIGGTGNDRLLGDAGRDRFLGGAGNDALAGGAGSDAFLFRGDWGADRIADFQNGLDTLDLRSTGLSFASLSVRAADVDRDGVADDALIGAAGGRSIGLLDIRAAVVEGSDFLF